MLAALTTPLGRPSLNASPAGSPRPRTVEPILVSVYIRALC